MYHGVVSCGVTRLEHLRVEELVKRVDWDVLEMGHWLRLSFESHQSVPGNATVVEMTMGDDVLSSASRNKESEL